MAGVLAGAICISVGQTRAYAAPVTQAATAEALADELAARLSASDYPRIEQLICAAGWNLARSGASGSPTRTPAETIQYLRDNAAGGRLDVTVRTRPLYRNDAGPRPGLSSFSPYGGRHISATPT